MAISTTRGILTSNVLVLIELNIAGKKRLLATKRWITTCEVQLYSYYRNLGIYGESYIFIIKASEAISSS